MSGDIRKEENVLNGRWKAEKEHEAANLSDGGVGYLHPAFGGLADAHSELFFAATHSVAHVPEPAKYYYLMDAMREVGILNGVQ